MHCNSVHGCAQACCKFVTGKMVYHGPREGILPFFATLGMACPERKADSDFLQEVTSRKDQEVSLYLHNAVCNRHTLFCAQSHSALRTKSYATGVERSGSVLDIWVAGFSS